MCQAGSRADDGGAQPHAVAHGDGDVAGLNVHARVRRCLPSTRARHARRRHLQSDRRVAVRGESSTWTAGIAAVPRPAESLPVGSSRKAITSPARLLSRGHGCPALVDLSQRFTLVPVTITTSGMTNTTETLLPNISDTGHGSVIGGGVSACEMPCATWSFDQENTVDRPRKLGHFDQVTARSTVSIPTVPATRAAASSAIHPESCTGQVAPGV